ncbi:MAG: NAD(P)/FAD-dependent oxidoreductase [Acholeplasmataceae bacterium]|nr:NAD(P)/FAD-dependent oxidoreductase [Acholeplasmataceae bacterium]
MHPKRVIIIGGGASGMMAALSARKNSADVTIIERNHKLGKKILATGNGRCNFTNVDATPNNYNHPDFVNSIFEQFSVDKTISFFKQLGIYPKIEDEGKTYPLSEQASSINMLFEEEIKHQKIHVVYETFVKEITKQGDVFQINTDKDTYTADRVILATGGKALPQSGSDGNGYFLSESLGHHITDVYPSLVKLTLDSPYLKHLDGVKFKGTVELLDYKQIIQSEFSDVLFTKYGVSGPGILQLSRKANELIHQNKDVWIKVIIINYIEKLDVIERMKDMKDRQIKHFLTGLIHHKLIDPILKETKIPKDKILQELTKEESRNLLSILFDWRFKVTGSKDFTEAQVTAGGVRIDEIHAHTLESKIMPKLYFTGEILDIDALCGGFNLQWAWSSGYVAGYHASM